MASLAGLLVAPPAGAQTEQDRPCTILCAPELKLEPTFTIEHLAGRPRLNVDGAVERVPRETTFELILALDVPTEIPRIGLTFEAILVPFGERPVHPFTGVAASELRRSSIRDNGIEIESELNVELIDTDQTAGWVSSHVDLVDKLSPGETPRAGSVYTHKLNFEWDTAFRVFHRLQHAPWLRRVEVELSLDYLATGLPKAGDVIGGEQYLDKASPWSLSFVFVFPLAPLGP
ncbi:MAG: hypothetical protein A3I61_18355 [Acidobacteria bacterium RIFCSPLOWO2_02_FULL_68_18]|nr:MAG: hypothetical protein A3I61_18355 [Acidobacteria bacterium RIFCSPLOWO2_02_FULL_68_18]OFW48016.1 MAG: hypothetical protein A3G77_10970 [Acidobacteria bacterium RIFCSPLOWO2_12_FULL_68_19]